MGEFSSTLQQGFIGLFVGYLDQLRRLENVVPIKGLSDGKIKHW